MKRRNIIEKVVAKNNTMFPLNGVGTKPNIEINNKDRKKTIVYKK